MSSALYIQGKFFVNKIPQISTTDLTAWYVRKTFVQLLLFIRLYHYA